MKPAKKAPNSDVKEGAGNNAFLLEKSRENPFWDLE
jgi:hypothetical protein